MDDPAPALNQHFTGAAAMPAQPLPRLRLCVACCLLWWQGAAFSQEPDAIARRMNEFVQAKQISGAVTLVSHDGRIVHHAAVGLADVEAARPMAVDSLFAIASMTKPITATALMTLYDEGKVQLDDPVAKFLPDFKHVALESGPAKTTMTVRHLLTHTSGLGGEQRCVGSLPETAAELATRKLSFEPGAKWQYSPSLNVIGRIIEIVGGQSYEDFLAKRIFAPLQMQDTTFRPNAAQRARLARLYEPGSAPQSLAPATHWLTELSKDAVANPSGGLYSTATDLARFYQMILNGGEWDGRRIVSPQAVKLMTTNQTGDVTTGFTAGNCWGLGWCVILQPQGVTDTLSPGTYGHGGAFGTQGWVDPLTRTIHILLIQRTKFGNSDGADLRGEFHRLAAELTKS